MYMKHCCLSCGFTFHYLLCPFLFFLFFFFSFLFFFFFFFIGHLLLDLAHPAQNCEQTLNRTHRHSPERHCAGSLRPSPLQVPQSLGWERLAMPSTKQSAPVGRSSTSQYFRCLGKRLFPEDRSGGLVGLGPSESKLKRSLPVRRICSSSFLWRFMSERTLSRRASRFWLRAELPGVRLLSISESFGVIGSSSKSNSVGMCGLG